MRCRAYSGLESGKLEIKIEDRELGDDDDDVIADNYKVCFCVFSLFFFTLVVSDFHLILAYECPVFSGM